MLPIKLIFLNHRRGALQTWKQKYGDAATFSKLIIAFKQAGYQEYADNVKKIGLQKSKHDFSGNRVEKLQQPPTYPKQETQSVSQHPPVTSKASETVNVMIVKESLTTGKNYYLT